MNMNEEASQKYLEARKAVQGSEDPEAFLNLGLIYAKGIGISVNHSLAAYFFEKAVELGNKEASGYLELEYELGNRNISKEIAQNTDSKGKIDPRTVERFRKMIENEVAKKNYGTVAKIAEHISAIYPEYDSEKGIDDILNVRHTLDANIFYSLSSSYLKYEVHTDLQEELLQQLFVPITCNREILRALRKCDLTDLYSDEEEELIIRSCHFAEIYKTICKDHGIKNAVKEKIVVSAAFPYISPITLVMLRQQALRMILSLRYFVPFIINQFLENILNSDRLLNICEEIEVEDIQDLLLTFIELDLDIMALETTTYTLLQSYRKHNMYVLGDHLNQYLSRLQDAGVEHGLADFTEENLPTINIETIFG